MGCHSSYEVGFGLLPAKSMLRVVHPFVIIEHVAS